MGKYNFELDLYDDNTISWIAERVKEKSVVLEFGPAHGRLTKYLKEKKSCRVDIVEIDEESGTDAAAYADNALLGDEKGNIEKYYWLGNKKYDYIIFADVLEHLTNPEKVLKCCKNIIKDSGKVLVSVPNISHNSIIIDLINDNFNYNPTGILDNTHLKFFTRKSFADMAISAGWAVIEEKAKCIRVGETEIKNSYKDIPLNLRKELMHRPEGDVYQYMFTLADTNDYLLGKEYRVVSLDSTSYYYAELQYTNDGCLDYRRSVTKHFDPYLGKIDMRFFIPKGNTNILIKPLNCNCVLDNIKIEAVSDERTREITSFESNGIKIGDRYYSDHHNLEICAEIEDEENIIRFKADVCKYDFEDSVFDDVLRILLEEQKHIKDVCNAYETELARREAEYVHALQEKEKALIDNVNIYEAELARREAEYMRALEEKDQALYESVRIYEAELARREAEYMQKLEDVK